MYQLIIVGFLGLLAGTTIIMSDSKPDEATNTKWDQELQRVLSDPIVASPPTHTTTPKPIPPKTSATVPVEVFTSNVKIPTTAGLDIVEAKAKKELILHGYNDLFDQINRVIKDNKELIASVNFIVKEFREYISGVEKALNEDDGSDPISRNLAEIEIKKTKLQIQIFNAIKTKAENDNNVAVDLKTILSEKQLRLANSDAGYILAFDINIRMTPDYDLVEQIKISAFKNQQQFEKAVSK